MAKIIVPRQIAPTAINEFLGINDSQDVQMGLKLGEASYMRNWRVTQNYKLKKREGYIEIQKLGSGVVNGLAYFKGKLIVAHDNGIYELEMK